jgi:hypothetical protein
VTGASASSLEEAARAKEAVRERIWALMERERVPCFPGATGRIPNFAGGPVAAACLASLPEWRAARVVRATLTHRNSRSGHEPWPRASSCTWPCLAWPTSVPSSGSTLSGSISHPASPPPSPVRRAPGGGSAWPS